MDCRTPSSSVFHCLSEFAQIHVHRVSNTIQGAHPLPAPFPFCLQSFPASGSFPMSHCNDSAIPLLGIYSEKTLVWKDTWTRLFTAALFTKVRACKQSKCPLQMNGYRCDIHIPQYITISLEYCSVIKIEWNNAICTTWMDLDYLETIKKTKCQRIDAFKLWC